MFNVFDLYVLNFWVKFKTKTHVILKTRSWLGFCTRNMAIMDITHRFMCLTCGSLKFLIFWCPFQFAIDACRCFADTRHFSLIMVGVKETYHFLVSVYFTIKNHLDYQIWRRASFHSGSWLFRGVVGQTCRWSALGGRCTWRGVMEWEGHFSAIF